MALMAHLVIVLLAIDGAAGLTLILPDILALVARYHPVGFGRALILANCRLPAFQARRFGGVSSPDATPWRMRARSVCWWAALPGAAVWAEAAKWTGKSTANAAQVEKQGIFIGE